MITKRNGNGQTECVRCKEKGKFALNWDSFLYTFNDKPYCFDCLMEMLEEKDNIINKSIEYTEEILSQTKGLIGDYEYHIEEHKEILALLYDDKKVFKKQLSILRGEE